MASLNKFVDSLSNVFSLFSNSRSGIGTLQDSAKTVNVNIRSRRLLTSEILALYRNGLTQKLVDTIPETALNAEISINSKSNSDFDSTRILEKIAALEIKDIFCQATISARLFKEAYLVLDIEDGLELSEPTDIAKCKGLNSIFLFEYGDITPHFTNRKVDYYTLRTNNIQDLEGVNVHPSRVVRFTGKELTPLLQELNGNTGFSYIESFVEPLSGLSNSINVSANIISRFITFVFEMKGLKEMLIDTSSEDALRQRMQIHGQSVGSTGGFVIDGDTEKLSFLNANLQGIPETISKQERLFTATSELPHDILWNEGSNSTSSDVEVINLHRLVNRFLNRQWLKPLNYIVSFLGKEFTKDALVCRLVLPEPVLSLKERLEAQKKLAEIDEIYMKYAVVNPEEIYQRRFGDSGILNTLFNDSACKPVYISPVNSKGEPRIITDTAVISSIPQVTIADLENMVARLKEESPLLEGFVLADEFNPETDEE
jgi:hypothetical protein